ncbi:MAG: lysylphosphatidylglycerol synthase transmembrane domain-containing protein [Nanoarchaeota archaeon]|nr:lysylphosphatidylglycerol synthase transmembrane domain-containing protein [Nanoarchaeota archaeon]
MQKYISSVLKFWPRVIKYFLGPLLLVILFWTIGIKQIWSLLAATEFKYLVLAYLFFIVSVFIAVMNLYILFYPLQKIDPRRFIQYFFASRVTSLIFPGRLGEFSLSYYLKGENINLGRGVAAVVTDKLITVTISMLLGIIAVSAFMKGQHITAFVLYVFLMLMLFVLLLSSRSRDFIKKWILRKYARHFAGFSKTLFSYEQEHKDMVLLNMVFTLVRMMVLALSAKAMFLALETDIPLLTLILVSGLETLSNSIPLTVNGLGIKQAIGVYVFSAIGVSPVITGTRYVLGFLIEYSFGFFSTFFIRDDLFVEKKVEELH